MFFLIATSFLVNKGEYIISKLFQCFISHVTNAWNWNTIISAAEGVVKLFKNYFSDNEHVEKYSW